VKVAVIAPTHLPARRANTLQVMKMAQALVCLGHTVRVAVPGFPPEPVSWEEIASLYGLRVQIPLVWLPAWSSLRRYDYGLRAVRWAQSWRADLIYTRLPQAAALASTLGIATVLEIHDLPYSRAGAWLFRRFLKGRGARRLVAITHTLATDLTSKLGAPAARGMPLQADLPPFTLVAPDGVDLERYANLPDPQEARRRLADAVRDLSLHPHRYTVGYTGHLYSGRGAEMILEMAARLPDTNFLLVGGEPDEVQRLRSTVKSRGLDHVILAGFVPNAELPRYHAACDLFLMPYQQRVAASSGGDISRYLSPMKLFEYMACDRPILCSDLPVLREVLNSSNAVLLPPEDVEAWVSALQSLRDNPERCLALSGQARCEVEGYTWEARAERILEGINREGHSKANRA